MYIKTSSRNLQHIYDRKDFEFAENVHMYVQRAYTAIQRGLKYENTYEQRQQAEQSSLASEAKAS